MAINEGIGYLDDILVLNVHNGRQHEGKGLPRARLSDSYHVPTRQSNRPALTLNAGRFGEPLLRESLVDVLGKPCLVKVGDRSGDVLALDCHLVLPAELPDVVFTPGSDVSVLLSGIG